jgi:hypothetical protein
LRCGLSARLPLSAAAILTFLDGDQREIMLNDKSRLADFDPQEPAQP